MVEETLPENIRNFAVIAHVDHGKTTLTDRILEMTGAVAKREMREQFLDSLELERERGITIKLKAVRLNYQRPIPPQRDLTLLAEPALAWPAQAVATNYQLNLIDTPGHVDFGDEVSRSLAACEGAVLVVDATQGVQAQTVANFYKAVENGLVVIPFVNKIDLPNARIEETVREIGEAFSLRPENILLGSAKEGRGVRELLEAIVMKIPAPRGRQEDPVKALVFDSYFDEHKGVVAFVKVVSGSISPVALDRAKKYLHLLASGVEMAVREVGVFAPEPKSLESLTAGEVGFLVTGLKKVSQIRVGETVADSERVTALPGYREPKPMVFLGFYPTAETDFVRLRSALERLHLSDGSFTFEAEAAGSLGLGFRCGFLGLLHAEIVQERLEREAGIDLIATVPSVAYEVLLRNGQRILLRKVSDLPDFSGIEKVFEPYVELFIYAPEANTGSIIKLLNAYRAEYRNREYFGKMVRFIFDLPLAELISGFYDRLKSATAGYGSLDYSLSGFREGNFCRLDILIAGKLIEPLSQIVPREQSSLIGKKILTGLKETIEAHQFTIVLQAAVGGKIIAREEITARRKNVLAKMSGGHRERKDKLLERQRQGKKRLKILGKVEIGPAVFRKVLGRS